MMTWVLITQEQEKLPCNAMFNLRQAQDTQKARATPLKGVEGGCNWKLGLNKSNFQPKPLKEEIIWGQPK